MPRLKMAQDANDVKFYPISITHGIYDTVRNKRLNAVLDDISGALDNKADMTAVVSLISSISIDPTTGMVSLTIGEEEVAEESNEEEA